jgi:hypothetical protein
MNCGNSPMEEDFCNLKCYEAFRDKTISDLLKEYPLDPCLLGSFLHFYDQHFNKYE